MDNEKQLSEWMDNPPEDMDKLLAQDPELAATYQAWKDQEQLHIDSMVEEPTPFAIEAAWNDFEKRIAEPVEDDSRKVVAFPYRWVAGITAAAAALAISFIGVNYFNAPSEPLEMSTVSFVSTDIEGATPMIYVDEPSGWTIVWVEEPPVTAES